MTLHKSVSTQNLRGFHRRASNCRTTLPLKGQGERGHTSPPERELARKGHLEGSSDFQSAQGALIARQQGDKYPNCIPSLPQLQGSWAKLILDVRGKRSHGCDLCGWEQEAGWEEGSGEREDLPHRRSPSSQPSHDCSHCSGDWIYILLWSFKTPLR